MGDDEPTTTRRRAGRSLSAFLRHPLVAIAATSLIGSLLVPRLADSIETRKQLRERKHAIATKIFEKALTDSSALAELDTILRHAYRSNPPPATQRRGGDKERREALERARAAFEATYLGFNRTAWYWPWQVYEEAQIEGALRGGSVAEFSRVAAEYSKELLQVSNCEKDLLVKLPGERPVPELAEDRNRSLEEGQARLYAHAKAMAQLVLAPNPCRVGLLGACFIER